MEMWSNYACLGYTIKALESLGYSEEEIGKIKGRMMYYFDMKTLDEAKEIYMNSYY